MSSEQDLKCVFCTETFSQKEELQIHFRKHADPNFNQKKKGRSQDEAEPSAENPKNSVEMVECDVCPEVFSSISKAITHKHKVHPDHDAKYFCPWCGKLFTMKHLYNKHIKASHESSAKTDDKYFHCDICDVDFKLPAAMTYHNKFFHRQDELPSIGHSKKLKMILQEIVQIFYCPFCGEEYDNKVNLHKHMTDDHNDENQSPEDVFRCPMCEALFYHLDAYELHLTYHSFEDLYTERSELMDEITDFSLETVPPLEEKIENAMQQPDAESNAMGIEGLFELTMGVASDNRKSKKHKKHKKSKKPAITLDEFLNMNNVFGEGIDFQGIEEVPTRVVAKRAKPKKQTAASKLSSPAIEKLKKQGIVVKKKPSKASKTAMTNKGAHNSSVQLIKNINTDTKTQSTVLTSSDALLSKLLNQGSQIKVVKKSNTDNTIEQINEEIKQHSEEKIDPEERLSPENLESKDNEGTEYMPNSSVNKGIATGNEEKVKNVSGDNEDINGSEGKVQENNSPEPKSPSPVNHKLSRSMQNCNENRRDSVNMDDDRSEDDRNQKITKIEESLNSLRKNSNIAIKTPVQNISKKIIKEDKAPENAVNDYVNGSKNKEKYIQSHEKDVTIPEKSSINALKHLSHLITIKPVNHAQITSPSNDKKAEQNVQSVEKSRKINVSQTNSPTSKSSEATNSLKNLSSITIKPTSSSKTVISSKPGEIHDDPDENYETDDEWKDQDNINTANAKNLDKISHLLRSPQVNTQFIKKSIALQNESPRKHPHNNDNNQSSANLIKHLKNVCTKSVNVNNQKTPSPKLSPNTVMRNIESKITHKEVTEEGIEIFNIDDSDSDEANGAPAIKNQANNTTVKSEIPRKDKEVLKVFNKNVTVKSVSPQRHIGNKNAERYSEDEGANWSDESDEHETHVNLKHSAHKQNQKQSVMNKVLKNLSKNITVKPNNSSANQSAQYQDHISPPSYTEVNEHDSDSDSPLTRVKITEMENTSDEEYHANVSANVPHNSNVKVEHPDDSHSDHDNEPFDEDFDDMSDINSQIPAFTLSKQNDISKSNSNLLKNLNKDITIKTSNENTVVNAKLETSFVAEKIPQLSKNLCNQTSVKQIKNNENPNSKNAKQIGQAVAHSTNQSSTQKMASTSNTFNKEVTTVKTFQTQTKTVIQEITTTVTKTIKTVNQTTKQETRNVAQSVSTPMIAQKIQGTNNLAKSFQGVKVRQSVPNVRPNVRSAAPQLNKPAICAPVRVSNQLVPARPGLNRPSGPRPRMPNSMNVRASTSGQPRPNIGTPVKVSPGAVLNMPKRSAEGPGHFSCFKKPKESLIPVPDLPMINNSDGETAQFSSAMHMSKSNFSSLTKTMKGNSVVTTTQMKSEMSASSQQLSKLRNMSGLSVVKTSQVKQTHVEENSEMSASKRNTLEAIQKLQSQGLLVKKPRLEVSEDSDHCNLGSEQMGHNSNDEFD